MAGCSLFSTSVVSAEVMSSPDQLRQRMAWALAQILVVGPNGLGHYGPLNEIWTNYYDILVRKASDLT